MASKVPAKKVLFTTILIDIGDLVMLGITSIITGSILMVAQLLQGIGNVMVDSFLIIGLKQSHKKRDKKHPLGYGRVLYIWTLYAAIIMFVFISSLAIYVGWRRFIAPELIKNIWIALGILSFSLITNSYGVYLSIKRLRGESHHEKRKIGRGVRGIWQRYNESSYVETKAAFITDLSGSLSAIVGIVAFVGFLISGNLKIDGAGAIIIGLVEAFFAFSLILNVKDLLIGRGISPITNEKVREAALSIKNVEGVENILSERLGLERLLVDLDIRVKEGLQTHEIENLTQEVKEKIEQEVPEAHTVYVELAKHTHV